VPGVSEVASIGGYVKQYQVEVDPNKLASYNISIQKIKKAIKRSNSDVGGKLLEMGETEFMVRGLGYIKSVEDIKKIVVSFDKKGTPILLKDIANVHIVPELRRGILEWNGEGEAVGGIVIMRYGENALDVIKRVKQKLKEMNSSIDLHESIIEGAVERVRPLIMTVATTLIGLLPVMVGTGAGSQIMKRIAAPMVGGLISSTVMTLIIIPVIYNLWKTWEIKPK